MCLTIQLSNQAKPYVYWEVFGFYGDKSGFYWDECLIFEQIYLRSGMFFRVASIVTNHIQSFSGCGFRSEFNSFHLFSARFIQVNAESTGGSKKIILNSPYKPLVERDWRALVIGDDRFP